MRGAIMEAYCSAATVPPIRKVADKSPKRTGTAGTTAIWVGGLEAEFVYWYQAKAPAATTIRRTPNKNFPLGFLGSTGRGTTTGPGADGASGATVLSGLGAGALLE